jgi:elongation factor 2
MRAVDGAVVVIDAVEGTMPQTETVLRQALKEHVKPVLFINKVDRLINELQVDGQEMQIRLGKLIDHVNKLIKGMNEERYKAGWKVDAAEGTVAFGSGLYNWAISVPMMQKTGVSFQQIYDYNKSEDPNSIRELADKCPLHEVLNDMVIRFLPSPLEAQEGRISAIWHGDKTSPIYKSMINADPKLQPEGYSVDHLSVEWKFSYPAHQERTEFSRSVFSWVQRDLKWRRSLQETLQL